MPISLSVSGQQGIIVWWKNAGGDAALPAVLIAILVRRYTVLTGLGAARVIGPAIPTLGAIESIAMWTGPGARFNCCATGRLEQEW
jgi:hypothetical protein